MKNLFLRTVIFTCLFPALVVAQWSARQSMGSANSRVFSTSFSINGKVYVVGGQFNYNGLADVWEYDPGNDSWKQKGPFLPGIRGGAAAFTIGNKAYFMCGSDYNGQYFDDVWEYDPSVDKWNKRGNFPGGQREELVAFTIGNKAYAGTGYQEIVGPNSTFFITYADLWEYDPTSDQWTQKALLPGPPRGWAIGAAVGGKGYIGLGSNSSQNLSYSDFYEYDPVTDAWTSKASYGQSLGDAMCFTIGQELYVCGGIDFANYAGSASLKKYDPATNAWSTLQAMPAGVTMGGTGVTCNNRGFVGTGYNGALKEKNDWWEFAKTTTTCPAPIAYTTNISAATASQCNGKIIISNITYGCAPYTVSIMPASGTVVTVTGSATDFTIANLCAGNYTVKVADNFCCGATQKTFTVGGSNVTGISEEQERAVSIYPNPGEGRYVITLGESNIAKENISVINTLGQEVAFELLYDPEKTELILKEPITGVYTLFYRDEKWSTTKKLVVR